jgi:probable F420-dependent oxidoreductase
VKFGVAIPTYGRFADPGAALRLIGAAERLGYDGAWFSDHVAIPDYATGWVPPPHLEALATCIMGMGRTTGLCFGVDVLVAPYRHPLVLAATAATADRLSGGRLVLGIGVGYLEGEFSALGLPYDDRGALTDEVLTVLRRVWAGPRPASHTGPHWPFADVHAGVPPTRTGGVPLWVGGNAARAITRAALLGDGWHPLWPDPDGYSRARARIQSLRDEAGIDRPFTFSLSAPRLDPQPATSPGLNQPRRRAEYGYVPPFPRDDNGRVRFTGSADQMTADVEAYAAAGVTHLTIRLWTSASPMGEAEVTGRMGEFAATVMARCR